MVLSKVCALAWQLQAWSGTANGQHMLLKIAASLSPHDLPLVSVVRHTISAVRVDVDSASLSPLRGARASVALVRADLRVWGAAIGYESLVVIRTITISLEEIVVPTARYRRSDKGAVIDGVLMACMVVPEERQPEVP
jgi:hypothetical protein